MSEQADAVPEIPQQATPAVQAQAQQPTETSGETKAAQTNASQAQAEAAQAKVSTAGAPANTSQAQAKTAQAPQVDPSTTGEAAQPVQAQATAGAPANTSQAQADESIKGPRLIDHMQWGWLAVFVLAVCFIWGNSMRQGVDSSHLSNEAFFMIQGILADLGLPYSWLTDHIVRKTAHFTEYTALGIIAMQAFTPHRDKFCWAALGTFLLAVLAIPCLDETLQLFVDGRSGQVSDVLLDCSGILFGSILTLAAGALYVKARAHRASRPDLETAADPLSPTPVLS